MIALLTLMAEEHPPSPNREDESLLLWRLRVKLAMRVKGAVFGIWFKDLLYFIRHGPVISHHNRFLDFLHHAET